MMDVAESRMRFDRDLTA